MLQGRSNRLPVFAKKATAGEARLTRPREQCRSCGAWSSGRPLTINMALRTELALMLAPAKLAAYSKNEMLNPGASAAGSFFRMYRDRSPASFALLLILQRAHLDITTGKRLKTDRPFHSGGKLRALHTLARDPIRNVMAAVSRYARLQLPLSFFRVRIHGLPI